jgi:hypothetical protein
MNRLFEVILAEGGGMESYSIWAKDQASAEKKALEQSRARAAIPGGLKKCVEIEEIKDPLPLFQLTLKGKSLIVSSKISHIEDAMKRDWSKTETTPILEKSAMGIPRNTTNEIPIPLEWLNLKNKESTQAYTAAHPIMMMVAQLPKAERFKNQGITKKDGVGQSPPERNG